MWWFAVILAVLASFFGISALVMEDMGVWRDAAYIGFAFTMALFLINVVFGAMKERGRMINQAADTGVQQRHTGHA